VTDQLPGWMKEMAPRLSEIDPDFLGSIGGLMVVGNRPDDALDGKVRILIVMALDLAAGSLEGTENMAGMSMGYGATEAQIADVVEVCCAMVALQRVAVGSVAFLDEAPASLDALTALGSILGAADPEFLAAAELVVASVFETSSEDGLSTKDKLLIALSLDAAFGSTAGIRVGAERCRAAGASDAEILSVLKMSFVNGVLLRLSVGRVCFSA
jgi:alkylhydroperoxidase/carboxymuconolactone decarboxylase family protein YurZ